MKFENQYIIHFKGLKEGVHAFEYKISKPFFEDYLNLNVPDGKINIKVHLIKKVHFMELAIDLKGDIQVQCDRCLEHFRLPITYHGHLMVKFSETENETDDEIMVLHPEDDKLELKHYLYECISLVIPMRKIHPDLPGGKPGCNAEMINKLKEHLIQE